MLFLYTKPAAQCIHLQVQNVTLCSWCVCFLSGAGGYESVGKMGLAVTGTVGEKNFKLLAYDKSKTTIAAATVYSEFSFTPQPNNYAGFYDDQRMNWSVRFDTDEAATEFAKHVGLARFNTDASKLVTQDVFPGTSSLEVPF